jgi:hypothetical protein
MPSSKPIKLLTLIAIFELIAGAGLLVAPSTVVLLLTGLDAGQDGGLLIARIAGAALACLAICCWLESRSLRVGTPTPLLSGLLAYNALVPGLLVVSSLAGNGHGPGLWSAVILHLAVAAWIAVHLARHQRPGH